jgi:hypothetical protein
MDDKFLCLLDINCTMDSILKRVVYSIEQYRENYYLVHSSEQHDTMVYIER